MSDDAGLPIEKVRPPGKCLECGSPVEAGVAAQGRFTVGEEPDFGIATPDEAQRRHGIGDPRVGEEYLWTSTQGICTNSDCTWEISVSATKIAGN